MYMLFSRSQLTAPGTLKPWKTSFIQAKLTKSENKKELWNKSIGGFSSKKNLLTLVKKKSNSADSANIQEKTTGLNNKSNTGISSSLSAIKGSDKDNSNKALTSNVMNKNENKTDSTGNKPKISGLQMLGDYPDSSSDSGSD